MKERTGILFTSQEIMLEWLIFLAGTLLFIINLSAREQLTVPDPNGNADATIVLPHDLQEQLATYKTLLTASTLNPNDTAAGQATAAAKTQLDTQLSQAQQDVQDTKAQIQATTTADAGLGSDVSALHEQISSYEQTLPTLKDTLKKAEVVTADKVTDTSVMLAKAVAACVIGVFGVFVHGVY